MRRLNWFLVVLIAAAWVVSNLPVAAAATKLLPRASLDRPDVSELYQVHVIYALPRDGSDRLLDQVGIIGRSLEVMNTWLQGATKGRRLRFDRTASGDIDISFVKLSRDESTLKAFRSRIRGEIEKEINGLGFNHPRKVYLVYYEGRSTKTCGASSRPPLLKGNTAVLYLLTSFKKAPPCYKHRFQREKPGWWENTAIHELLHTFGFAAECGKNWSKGSHVSDDKMDILYGGRRGPGRRVIDVGNDDYFNHGVAGCPDFANSVFLDPLPSHPELPPAWDATMHCIYQGYGKRTCKPIGD